MPSTTKHIAEMHFNYGFGETGLGTDRADDGYLGLHPSERHLASYFEW
jgi:hypothetical protein